MTKRSIFLSILLILLGVTSFGAYAQEIEHEHNFIESAVIPPTCTEKGYTLLTCSECGEEVHDRILPALGHKPVIDAAVPAAAGVQGLSEGSHCEVCHLILEEQHPVETLPMGQEADPSFNDNEESVLPTEEIPSEEVPTEESTELPTEVIPTEETPEETPTEEVTEEATEEPTLEPTAEATLVTMQEVTADRVDAGGLGLKITYQEPIKGGVPTRFTVQASNGSGNYVYRLNSVMDQEEGQGYFVNLVVDPRKMDGFSEKNTFDFTFMASGQYQLDFYVMDKGSTPMQTKRERIVVEVNDPKYPSIVTIADQVAKDCNKGSQYDKALCAHDWLVEKNTYDYTYLFGGAEAALARGTAICDGLHRAYVMLLNRLGIESQRIEGNGHVWTGVKIDGVWTHVDVTWDVDSDNYFWRDMNMKYLYFGMDDTFAKIAHSESPGTGGTSLENHYFIKSGMVRKWSDPIAEQIQEKLDQGVGKVSNFTIYGSTLDTVDVYRKYKGLTAAYDLSTRSWLVNGNPVKVSATFDTNTFTFNIKADVIPFTNRLEIVRADGALIQEMVDLSVLNTPITLTAVTAPANANPNVKWTSSAPEVATIPANGGTIVINKPGTTTITAETSDGSNLSVSKTFTFFYIDTASSFTGKFSEKSLTYNENTDIGLQVGDSIRLNIYGTDENTPMNPDLFSYKIVQKKNDLTDQGNGIFLANLSGNTVSVQANLKDDPLNRSVSMNLKLIPIQLSKVIIKPTSDVPLTVYLDANGDVTKNENEAVSYAIYLQKSSSAQKITVNATAFINAQTVASSDRVSYTWSSANTALATIGTSTSGTNIITIKAKADGACTIKATSKADAKNLGTISVYVMDLQPRLGSSAATLNSFNDAAQTNIPFVESYLNTIDNLTVLAYNAKSKQYDTVSTQFLAEYRNDTLSLRPADVLANGTYKIRIDALTANGMTYTYPFTVTVKNALPTITVAQDKANAFDLFLTDSVVPLTVSAANGGSPVTITSAEVDSAVNPVFAGDWQNGTMRVKFADGQATLSPKSKAIRLNVVLAGWKRGAVIPVNFTLTTTSGKPEIAANPATVTVNTVTGANTAAEVTFTNKKTAEVIRPQANSVSQSGTTAFATVAQSADGAMIQLVPNAAGKYSGGKVTLSLRQPNWTSAVNAAVTVKVITTAPKAVLSKTAFALNNLYPNRGDFATVKLDQANLHLDRIPAADFVPAKASKEADKILVRYENGRVNVSIRDGVKPAAGTYNFTLKPTYEGQAMGAVNVSVKVTSSVPAALLSASTLRFDSANVLNAKADLNVVLTPADGLTVIGVNAVTTAAKTLQAQANLIQFEHKDGVLTVKLPDSAMLKAGNYPFNVSLRVRNSAGEEFNSAVTKLTVTVLDNAKTTVTYATSGSLDMVNRVNGGLTYAVNAVSNNTGKVTGITLEGTHAALFDISTLFTDANGRPAVTIRLKTDNGVSYKKNGSYSIRLRANFDNGTTVLSGNLTVKVTESAAKYTLSPASQVFYQSQRRDRVLSYTVTLTTPVGGRIGSVETGTVNFWQSNLANQSRKIDIVIAPDGRSATVSITLKDTGSLNFGKTYTLPLLLKLEGSETSTKVNLSLKIMK